MQHKYERAMRIFLATMMILFISYGIYAQIPQTLNFQGILSDPGTGDPVADANYNLTFKIYDVVTAGTKLWEEAHPNTPVQSGIYNVILGGNGVPLDIPFDTEYYLEIVIGAETLSPRLTLTASAYSLNARSMVGTDNIFPSTGNVGIGTLSPTSELDVTGTIKATAIQGDGSGLTDVDAVSLQGKPVVSTAPTDGQVLKWNNTNSAWEPGNDANTNTTYSAGTGMVLSGTTFNNTGDTDASNDITTTSTAGGDIGGTFDNLAIGTGKVTSTMISDRTITELDISNTAGIKGAQILDGTIAYNDLADGSVGNAKIASNSIDSTHIMFGQVTTTKIKDRTITGSDISLTADISSSQILDGTLTGADIAPGSIGASSIADGSVGAAEIANNAIGSSEIAYQAIESSDIAVGAVGASEIADGSITYLDISATAQIYGAQISQGVIGTTHLVNGAVTTDKIAFNTIVADDIDFGGVGSDEILDGSITQADISPTANILGSMISASSVPGDRIQFGTITTGHIANYTIVANDIASDVIGINQIGDNAVGTDEIVDATITNTDISATAAIDGSKVTPDFGSQVTKTGAVIRPSETANLVPFAYGTVFGSVIQQGTSNIAALTKTGTGTYVIQFTGFTYAALSHPTLVTPVSSSLAFPVVTDDGVSKLVIKIYNTTFNLVDRNFSFVVYAPYEY